MTANGKIVNIRLPWHWTGAWRVRVSRCAGADAEREALDYVTELTTHKKVNPDTFTRLPSTIPRGHLRNCLARCQ